LKSGKSWESFRKLVIAQGGDVSYVDSPERLAQARLVESVPSPRGGYLQTMDAKIIGETACFLGAGRDRKGDPIDPAVGIVVLHKVGDRVQAGEPLFTIYANQENLLEQARPRILAAYSWSDMPVAPLPLFYGVIQD
jgi:pyrimidine-nucleoside phosphorylase